MKKRILAMLLSALMMVNISGCSYASEKEIDETLEDTTFPESTAEESEETDTETPQTTGEGTIACNGVYYNSCVTYTFNQKGDFVLYIEDWNEYKTIPYFNYSKTLLTDIIFTVAVNENFAFLIFKPYGQSTTPLNIIRITKGNEEMIANQISIADIIYFNNLYCNFINSQVGYLFVFEEGIGGFASGHIQLKTILKTDDGGITWGSIKTDNSPLINWKNTICFSKIINDNIGIISGRYWADDYDFCKRTLLTTDCGLNWVNITRLPQIDTLCGTEVTDFIQVDDAYILTIRHKTSETDYSYVKYQSLDLITWILTS